MINPHYHQEKLVDEELITYIKLEECVQIKHSMQEMVSDFCICHVR